SPGFLAGAEAGGGGAAAAPRRPGGVRGKLLRLPHDPVARGLGARLREDGGAASRVRPFSRESRIPELKRRLRQRLHGSASAPVAGARARRLPPPGGSLA